MATTELLQARVEGQPSIYAYELPEVPSHRGLLKVGYTVRTAEERHRYRQRRRHQRLGGERGGGEHRIFD